MGKLNLRVLIEAVDRATGPIRRVARALRVDLPNATRIAGGALRRMTGLAVKAGTSLAEIGRWSDITATFEADTGQTWVISNGWVTEPPTVTDNDGKAKIVIEGPPAEEMS